MDDRDPAVQRYSPKQNKLYSYQAAINTISHDPASCSPCSGGKNLFGPGCSQARPVVESPGANWTDNVRKKQIPTSFST